MVRAQYLIGSLGIIVGVALGMTLLPATTSAQNLKFKTVRDCDQSSVINCGALSTNELLQAYDASPNIQALYSSVGITKVELHSLGQTARAGSVSPNGQIVLAGTTVPLATNNVVYSIANIQQSIKEQSKSFTYFQNAPAQIIKPKTADAYIYLADNKFQFAILVSNGDPVTKAMPSYTQASESKATIKPSKIASTLVNTGPNSTDLISLSAIASLTGAALSYRHKLRYL
jgi:hypothetical protein